MKKIKKAILNALEYSEQNPCQSLTKIAEMFQVDRHTLSDYKKIDIDEDCLFESCKPQEEEFLYYFSKEELDVLEYYKEHSEEPFYSIKEKFNACPNTVRALRNWMDVIGEEYHTGQISTYHYNSNKFNTIETEEDAYWLGFITADGCIIREDRALQIKLATRDRNHLVKFCKYMEIPDQEIDKIIKEDYGGSYNHDNIVNTVKIYNKTFVKHLLDKGITPRKSGKEKPYICNSLELQKAYIRGLVDGDGWINKDYIGIGLCGSYDICNYFHTFVSENVLDVNKTDIGINETIYRVEWRSKNDVENILNLLYSDATIYLDRKYELYLKWSQNK